MENQIQVNQKDQIREILNKCIEEEKISNFRLIKSNSQKINFYVEKDYKIESILKSNREELIVTTYVDYEDEIGESTFTITPNDSIEIIKKEINDSIFVCSNSKSKKYSLPKKDDPLVIEDNFDSGNFLNEKFNSDFNSDSISFVIEEKFNIIKNLIENEENIKLNAFEFLSSLTLKHLETSNNIEKNYSKDSAYMEFVLTAKTADKETEHIVYKDINDIYSFDFETFFKESISQVKNTMVAESAKSFKGKVILKDVAVKDFFTPDLTMNSFIGHASSRLKFQKISNYEIGNEIIKNPKHDKISIFSNPLLKNNNSSSPFDSDGITSKKICLIENNVFKNFFASVQFAQYLDIKPTGPLGSIEILPGKKLISDLLDDNEFIEIHTFSSFVPDLVSGDFSSEIRLGFYVKDGIRTPFKGGLFTGNIFKLLEEVELSKEEVEESGYKGPKVIKFHKGEIVGW